MDTYTKSFLSGDNDILLDNDNKLQYTTSIDWSISEIFFSIQTWSMRFRSGTLATNKMAALEDGMQTLMVDIRDR
jgi:hypothetical protein